MTDGFHFAACCPKCGGELLTDGLDEQAARALFRRHGVAWPA